MSVLNFPRVYFSGQIAWDPVTTNNYLSSKIPEHNQVGAPQARAAYDEDGCQATLNGAPVTGATVDAFRKQAVEEIVTAGSWNPQGTYRSPFFNTQVTGVDQGAGLSAADAFVGAPVTFTGMLVDCEPYGAFSSQLYFDEMSFGIRGGCRVWGKRITRISDRFINFQANPANNMIAGVASVMWQTCFAKDDGLIIDAGDSALLRQLQAAVAQSNAQGLMVRFVTHRTVYYDDPALSNGAVATTVAGRELQARIAAGGFQPNPARSLVYGTLGLWLDQECMTEASDRALVSQGYTTKDKAMFGTAFASVNTFPQSSSGRTCVSLDLSNALPWADKVPTRVNLGDLVLKAVNPDSAAPAIVLGHLPPEVYAGQATSGLFDIDIDASIAAQLDDYDLELTLADTASGQGAALATEDPIRAIPDTPNLYVNQNDTVSVGVTVYRRGKVAGAGIRVTMSDLVDTTMSSVRWRTDADGKVSFPVDTSNSTVQGLVFQAGGQPVLPVGGAFSPMTMTYMYLRVLPADAQLRSMPCTWQNVYDNVLCNWKAMAPCMDNWLDLSDPEQVLRYAPLIKQLTDPANFEDFRFMPVPRDLTAGQRHLLYRFLDRGTAAVSASSAPSNQTATVLAHSRAMRAP